MKNKNFNFGYQLAENREKKATKPHAKRTAEEVARDQKIDAWWESKGKVVWENRLVLPPFLGKEFAMLRFNREDEEYVAVVTVGKKQVDEETMITAAFGGLCGTPTLAPAKIFTFCSSTVEAPTLKEALWILVG